MTASLNDLSSKNEELLVENAKLSERVKKYKK